MRIHRISLKDFRGLEPVEVEFNADGITIVEGRNEIGKTSIADAFMLLLDARDTANTKQVRAVQPIGRDVGPYAEAELTVGPYRLVYRKRWIRQRMTELDMRAPAREQLTGEAAHNRVLEILDVETDPTLFRALRYEQGVAINQAALADAPGLAAALDAAAGGSDSAVGPGSDVLLGRVEQERSRYFTDKGAVTKSRKDRGTTLEELREEVAAAQDRIRKLDETAERQRMIEIELLDLNTQTPGLDEQVAQQRQVVEAVESMEHRVEVARYANEQAEAALREAEGAKDRRQGLIEAAADTAEALASLESDVAKAEPGLREARDAVTEAERIHNETSAALLAAEQEADRQRQTVAFFTTQLERDQFRERQERVTAADETIKSAEQFLAGCSVDDNLLSEIERAGEQLAVAQGRADTGMPHVSVDALQPVRVTINDDVRNASPGATIEELVSDEVQITIGDVARVTVSPPEAAGDAADALLQAERRLAELLKSGGVTSQKEAHDVARERSRQETERNAAVQRRQDALFDLEPAELAAKLGRAEERLAALEGEHDSSATAADSFDDARLLAENADAKARDARTLDGNQQTTLEAARAALRVLDERAIEQRTRLESARTAAAESARTLEEDRRTSPDADVEKAVEEARAQATGTLEELTAAEKKLAESDPETARAVLENAEKLQSDIRERIRAFEIESAETRKHLELEGHEGLADRLADASASLEDLQREVDSEDRRAASVERLHRVLSERREFAQRTYVRPFSEKVNSYARILYGADVHVDVDHQTLQIVSRTLNGTPVPFEWLSGGAREQLAVIARLACGALVSPATDGEPGGVPVLIDDALGYSDPDRLAKLGAALGLAGRDCQVIVLTCEPGRHRGIGGAKVVSLG